METFKYFFTYEDDIPDGLEVKIFSPQHIACLIASFITIIVLIHIYKKISVEKKKRLIRSCAVIIVLLEVIRDVWAASIGHFTLAGMLPLHLCGIMIFIELLAVFKNKTILKEFAYCAGLPGAFMAVATPASGKYPVLNIQYLQTITIHTFLMLVPLLWIVGDGFKPNIKNIPKCFLILCAIALFDAGVNLALGSNYLYISEAPDNTPLKTFENIAGNPGYIAITVAILIVVWIVMYLPWEMVRISEKNKNVMKNV